LKEKHAGEVAELQSMIDAANGDLTTELQVQHNRELEEQARHHAVALKEAQALYIQRYETFDKQKENALARQQEEFATKHRNLLNAEEEAQELAQQLSAATEREAALYKQVEELTASKEATEQGQLEELMQAQRELSERDAEHEKALHAAIEAQHEQYKSSMQKLQQQVDALKSGQHEVLKMARDEVAESHDAERKALEEALSHQTAEQENVLQQALQELVGQHKAEKQVLEDALSQLKESHEKQLQSSLKEASDRHAAERQFLEKALSERETEHAEALQAALDRQRAELVEKHRASTFQRGETAAGDAQSASVVETDSPTASTDRPLSSSATFTRPKRLSMSRGSSSTGLTLEGTLESIRLQTEQLLELNDDFIAERRRWSSRLSHARSSSGTVEGATRPNGVDAQENPSAVRAAS
jgi:hypothetical protein